MANGYMGKLLFVDLTNGTLKEETLDEKLCADFLGGYGIGARILYERMKPGVDPLGPDNLLGFMTGPLTGTPALTSGRYVVVCKSPLTGTWGDANSGGDFGPYMKFAGFDGVFFTGISPKPVYLSLADGKGELLDAGDLWGKDTQDTDDILRERHGERDTRVACIGLSGEKLSRIACVMNDKGRAAGRSGVGAVMGSKKLKAIIAKNTTEIPMVDADAAAQVRRDFIPKLNEGGVTLSDYGTAGFTAASARSGDSPTKNWGGSTVDFPNPESISDDAVIAEQERKYGCWRCTISCGGHMKQKPGRALISHKPEYETLCMAGSNCLNDDLESIIRVNDISNAYGVDTISMGAVIAFAIECYENEILSEQDTGGLQLRWGNADAIVALAEKIGAREGIGDLLAEGVKRAADKLGKGADAFAVHSQGQELPAHDPKFVPALASTYRMDATPGRHTQGGAGWIMGDSVMEDTRSDKFSADGFGELQNKAVNMVHVCNASGICLFGYNSYPIQFMVDALRAVTGKEYTVDELVTLGERIATMRHMFNLREGLNPLEFEVNGRSIGKPPVKDGPVGGVLIDEDALIQDYLRAMDWDPKTTRPSDAKLAALGLAGIA